MAKHKFASISLTVRDRAISRAEREDKNRGRISASRNSEIFEYSFGVF